MFTKIFLVILLLLNAYGTGEYLYNLLCADYPRRVKSATKKNDFIGLLVGAAITYALAYIVKGVV